MAEYGKPTPAPTGDDLRYDDQEFNPALEPKSAKAWLNLLQESEDAFENWNTHCDNIDKQYASLERLAQHARDKEFQMFWANCEVIKPSIYAKPPVPVVVPKFKDRRPVYQEASEVLERCATVAFDLTRINELMLLVRDDLALYGRGVPWCRYESGGDSDSNYDHEKVCVDFKGRRDFLHSVSRNWREVTWVAGASYLTRAEARQRFRPYSGDAYQDAEYRVDKDHERIGGADNRERAKFWEIWSKSERRVVWVAQGCDDILDEDDPHLDLQCFFPCPRPAYGTTQRGSLVPVPDVMQYKDQLEEINLLTSRIHALSDAVEAKGFYPAGGAELAEAIQAAVTTHTPGRMLIPIANWASFGQSNEVVIWLPIDQIVAAITGLVTLRKQVIDDIYQLTGMADIMRGDTDPNETLGAQQLKAQYGTTRIRDRQQELARISRDLVEITAEIITERFDDVTMVEMSQTQLPTTADMRKQIGQIQQQMAMAAQQAMQMLNSPQGQQMMQTQPDKLQQLQQQFQQQQMAQQQQIQTLALEPTIDQVLRFLRDNRIKSFVLDIETDSTIMADENAEKQRRSEFMQVLGGLLPQLAQMIASEPQTAGFCGELLKFATAPFRAGRALDGAIDELVEQMKQKGAQGKGDDPTTAAGKIQLQVEQMKLTYAKQKDDADRALKQQEIQLKSHTATQDNAIDAQAKQAEVAGRQQEHAMKLQQTQMEMEADRQHHAAALAQAQLKMQTDAAKNNMMLQQGAMKAAHIDQQAQDRRAQQQFKMTQPPRGGGLP
jgi:hypothetical protein